MRFLALFPVALAGYALALPSPRPEELARRNWPSVTTFLSKVAAVFPASVLVEDACGLITAGERTVAIVFGIPSSENDACGDVTVLWARGTCDPGNVGVLTAPWFFKALDSVVRASGRSLGVQGLDYPASVEGYLTGSEGPGQDLLVLLVPYTYMYRRGRVLTCPHNSADLVRNTVAECPDTKLVLGGYSQGGMVVHNAAADLDAGTMSKVSAVVIFGDPYSAQAVANIDASRVKIICHGGDNICDNGPLILLPHLTYAEDAGAAASFVMSQI
ncbi:Cutinase [Tolypocladium capitatum]|uniref:Cutinase n=1 Tax=Tolypocladium capitatum TaxID=45235 RepID=A0A2K3QLI3_9HYPO|nr:Cutinase [Tolypocladium capitatum]